MLAAGSQVEAEDGPPPSPPTMGAVRVENPPTLDGDVLGDEVWQHAPAATGFWQVAPDAGSPSSERTEVRIAFTADTLYVGVVCFDRDPAGIIVSDARRDSPLDDTDSFRFVLDTYRDRQNGFVFGTNPAGPEYDGQVANEGQGGGHGVMGGRQQGGSGGGFNLNWDGSWQVRARIHEAGWSAEFAIPFRILRFPSGDDQTWGVNFERFIRRRNETSYWAPLPRQFDLFRLSQAGSLSGLQVPRQRPLSLVPYLLSETVRDGDPARTITVGDIGGDAKYGITQSSTLDLTYNTDFAQVEVDEQQVNLDRFNLFFPEKRPFFLENAGLFSVGAPSEVELFFSRRIGLSDDGDEIPIIGGARLSGRIKGFSVGLLDMQTESFADEVPSNNFFVSRIRRDFANRTYVGGIFVNREGTGRVARERDYNRAFAADGRLGIGQYASLTGFIAGTHTPGASGDEKAFQVDARRDSPGSTVRVVYQQAGEAFNPEVGFLRREGGYRKPELALMSRIRPKSIGWLQELRPHTNYRGFWDLDGFQQTGYWHLDNHIEFKSGMEIHTGLNLTREGVVEAFEIHPGVFVPPATYDHKEAQFNFFTSEGNWWSFRIESTIGGFFGGDRVALEPVVRVRAGERFSTEVRWSRNDIDLPWGSFVTNLVRARVSYALSPRVLLQSLLQYNDSADLWSLNLRFSWLRTANTGLFVVYNDANEIEDSARGTAGGPINRTFIVKFSRMFDLQR